MVSKEDAKKEVKKLIDKYEKYKASGEIRNFIGKEETTKTTFILPFFKAIGWDVYNEKNLELVCEEGVLKGAVDYAFRLGGQNRFFVEAKPVGVELKDHAKQAIEYGVNSGNTWVVLTNFESLIVFNCEWKEKDWWKNALFGQLDYKDYLNNFDLIWLLSRESITSGGLDEWATRIGKKVPRTPIDKELLSKFLDWRLKLSKDISKKHNYSSEEIDEFVQKLLIRLLFIKNCEDRGFETNYKLLPVVEAYNIHKKGMLKLLRRIFDYYDKTYDSSIFENGEVDKISFDETCLFEILNGLHFTSDGLKYNFNVIPADVMGNLYEQYLGHILKKTPQTAKLKEGKAHRKEQGIYYTPTYIVDYIVRNTLGEMLKGKKVDASKIRVLDPACGSGSFLVKAFDVLNEHYAKDKMYGQKTLAGYSTKERILKNNIFGVDLDRQAAEIAQLNLLLKIAEKGQKLPLLKQNIKIGNSLIDDESVAPGKAFKWEEQFSGIMKEGGFDIVIGNPPYGAEIPLNQKEILDKKYKEDKTKNTAAYFIFRGLDLLKEGGYIAYIVPKQLTYISSWQYARKLLLGYDLIKIIDASEAFQDVELEQIIFILRKTKKTKERITVGFSNKGAILEETSNKQYFNESRFPLWITEENHSIFDKILQKSRPLNSFAKVNWGGPVAKFLTKEKTLDSVHCIRGREIQRYTLSSEWFIKKKDIVQSYYVKGEKLLFQRIVSRCGQVIIANYRDARIVGTYSKEDVYADKTVTLVWDTKISLKYLLGILNSKLLSWFAHRFLFNRSQLTMEFMYEYARNFPVYVPTDKTEIEKISKKVDLILEKSSRLNELGDKKTDDIKRLREERDKTDAEIDELVYKIYGIIEKEKKIIEESLK